MRLSLKKREKASNSKGYNQFQDDRRGMENQKLKEDNKSELLPTDNPLLTTPENALTYHNALSLSPQNFA